MKNSNNIFNKIIAVIFLAFIFVIPLCNILTPARKISEAENRTLQQFPQFSFKHLLDGSFTKDFESYISDQFFMRDNWVYAKSIIEKSIGKKDNNGIFLGKDGYLLQMFNGKDDELDKKLKAINTFADSNKNIKVNVMLVPNSVKVMSDKLPSFASPDDELEYINKVKKGLNSSISFIDIYNTLKSKNKEYIYYKTDHHWTTQGAYYAYRETAKTLGFIPHETDYYNIKKVTDSFYGTLYSESGYRDIKPDSIFMYIPKASESYIVKNCDNNKVSNSLYNMDCLKDKDKYAAFLDGNHSLIHISTNNKSGKSIVIVKDSYANSFIPFLTGHYSDIYVIDFRYFSDSLSKFEKDNNIKQMLILYNVNSFSQDTGIEAMNY